MSFRIFQPGTQFLTNDGRVLAGGSLTFCSSGTTDLADTYSDPALSVANPNPVPLDGAGRPNNDIWGDGSYRVILRDALGVTLVTLDDVSGPQGIPDPSLQSGRFLTNDGTEIFWQAIRQLTDPAGADAGAVLTTDGSGNTAWLPPPTSRAVPSPTGQADGNVLAVDDEAPAGYAWRAPAAVTNREWSIVTNERTLGSVYTNDTAREIQVIVTMNITLGGGSVGVQVNGATIGNAVNGSSGDNQIAFTFSVPPEATYRAMGSGSRSWITTWAELR